LAAFKKLLDEMAGADNEIAAKRESAKPPVVVPDAPVSVAARSWVSPSTLTQIRSSTGVKLPWIRAWKVGRFGSVVA